MPDQGLSRLPQSSEPIFVHACHIVFTLDIHHCLQEVQPKPCLLEVVMNMFRQHMDDLRCRRRRRR